MYHVLIIADNRILMKKVYEMIEDHSFYKVHVLPYSIDSFDVFYNNHIDIVIMDSDVLMEHGSILDAFTQCQWHYNVVLLTDHNEHFAERKEIIAIDKQELSPEILNQALGLAQNRQRFSEEDYKVISIDWEGSVDLIHSADAHTLILVRSTREACVTIDTEIDIKKALECFGDVKIIAMNTKEILFSIGRSTMTSEYQINKVSKILFKHLGSQFAILYLENISWKKLNQACERIKRLSGYCYFFENESVNVGIKRPISMPVPVAIIQQYMGTMVASIFDGDLELAVQIIKEIYLHRIKLGMDLKLRTFVRMHLNLIKNVCLGESPLGGSFVLNCSTLEEEVEIIKKLLAEIDGHVNKLESNKELIKRIYLEILKEYDTDLSLEGIADQIGFNKGYVNRTFKSFANKTVLEVLQLYKIQTAKFYLLTTDDKVSDISKSIGYSESGYFSKSFKKYVQMTPIDFRHSYMNNWERCESIESTMAP